MPRRENLESSFCFPREVEGEILAKLEKRFYEVELVGVGDKFKRVAVLPKEVLLGKVAAEQIIDEAVWLQLCRGKYLPRDEEAKVALEQYRNVGLLVLEAINLHCGNDIRNRNFPNIPDELLEKYRSGFTLLSWWEEQWPGEFGKLEEWQQSPALEGALNGIRRYLNLYKALEKIV